MTVQQIGERLLLAFILYGTEEVVQVDSKRLENIFAITHQTVQSWTEKKYAGELLYTEKRGNQKLDRKYKENNKNEVVNHINMFPCKVSRSSK